MIEVLDDRYYSPLCFTLWNDPDPAPVWLGRVVKERLDSAEREKEAKEN